MFKDLLNTNIQVVLRQDIKHSFDDTPYIIGTLLSYDDKFIKIKNIVNNEIWIIKINLITVILPSK